MLNRIDFIQFLIWFSLIQYAKIYCISSNLKAFNLFWYTQSIIQFNLKFQLEEMIQPNCLQIESFHKSKDMMD